MRDLAGFPFVRFLKVFVRLLPILGPYFVFRRTHRGRDPTPSESEKLSKQGKKLYKALVDLGPFFIKLGQTLSVRPDILPVEYTRELEKLQDEVPPAPFKKVLRIIEEELGPVTSVFESIDENPLASASLGQVHLAVYKGARVAVKVNRPGIQHIVEQDIKVLKAVLKVLGVFLDKNISMSIESVIREHSKKMFEEMDYNKELSNMEVIAEEIRGFGVITPKVYREVSRRRVLVMSYEEGVKISQVDSISAMGVDTKRLARRVARVFLTMLLEKPVFHADPHPGNLSVRKDGTLVIYDYGMVGSLDESTKRHLIRLYASFSFRDPGRIVDEMLELGILDPMANRSVIEKGLGLAIRELGGEKVSEWEFERLMELANRLIYKFPFRLPESLTLYMRMASILESVCTRLDPGFNFLRFLAGFLEEEGYLDELRKEDMANFLKSVVEATTSFLKLSPLLLKRLEEDRSQNGRGDLSKRLVWPSTLLFGLSLYGEYIHVDYSYLGLIASFLLLIVAAAKS